MLSWLSSGKATAQSEAPASDEPAAPGPAAHADAGELVNLVVREWQQRDIRAHVQQRMRPWGEFVAPSRFRRPSRATAQDRVLRNLEFFHVNYLAVALLCLLYTIVTTPALAITVVVCCGVWVFYTRLNKGPIQIHGFTLSHAHLLLLLVLVGFVMFALFGGLVGVLWSLGLASLLTLAHAVAHVPPNQHQPGEHELAVLGSDHEAANTEGEGADEEAAGAASVPS